MDAFELLSLLRDKSGLDGEDDMGTPLLLRNLNLGMQTVSNLIYKVFDQLLAKTVYFTTLSGNPITLPGDILNILTVWREKTAAANDWKPCTRLPLDMEAALGTLNYPDDNPDHPLYLFEGGTMNVYPAVGVPPPQQDVKLKYRKRTANLCYGKVQSGATVHVLFDVYAQPVDDVYNDYRVSLYTKTAGVMTLAQNLKISDYTGATRDAHLEAAHGLTPASTDVWYALHPLIPEEYHGLIVEAAMIELAASQKAVKAGKIDGGNIEQRKMSLRQSIVDVLQINDVQELQNIVPMRVREAKE